MATEHDLVGNKCTLIEKKKTAYNVKFLHNQTLLNSPQRCPQGEFFAPCPALYPVMSYPALLKKRLKKKRTLPCPALVGLLEQGRAGYPGK